MAIDNAQIDLISIIIPVYNSEKFLRDCVDSVLAQTYQNLEIILVNDGSTDSSGAICDDYASKDERIKMLHTANNGNYSARNAGLNVAKGAYIGFVDSDDTIEADMYTRLHQSIIKAKANICICGYQRVYGNSTKSFKTPNEEVISAAQFFSGILDETDSYIDLFVFIWNKLYSRELLYDQSETPNSSIRFNESLTAAGDTYFNADCFMALHQKSGKIAFESSTPYRQFATTNPRSVSKTGPIEDKVKAWQHYREAVLHVLPERSEEVNKHFDAEICVLKMKSLHMATVHKLPSTGRLSFGTLLAVLRSNGSLTMIKLPAFLLFLLPKWAYRLVFKAFSKG